MVKSTNIAKKKKQQENVQTKKKRKKLYKEYDNVMEGIVPKG